MFSDNEWSELVSFFFSISSTIIHKMSSDFSAASTRSLGDFLRDAIFEKAFIAVAKQNESGARVGLSDCINSFRRLNALSAESGKSLEPCAWITIVYAIVSGVTIFLSFNSSSTLLYSIPYSSKYSCFSNSWRSIMFRRTDSARSPAVACFEFA